MSLSRYIILMLIATLFCWGAFFIVLYTIDPFLTTTFGFILFYLSLFFALIGLFSLFGFLFRYKFNKHQFLNQQVIISFRQSILIAFLITISLYLKSHELIAWWNSIVLIIILAMIEYTLSAKNNSQQIIEQK